ncbi:patatin-like phospholipase family protein [Halocola ammonii]
MAAVVTSNAQQKVGVVLSGGGASGLAHVGFLKALEENNIPIDYITGTSMGAIIGAMYASGMSVEEIEDFVKSEQFALMASGGLREEYQFFFKKFDPDASLATLKFSKASLIEGSIPTNLIDPVLMDYEFLELFSQAAAAADYDFDNLFVPFRCVASDVEAKESVVFRSGHLSQAVRASSTYPFYLKPIEIDGKLLFDGGLYNNFPSDVMYSDFMPDVIIGCNVSENQVSPSMDSFMSQIRSMIQYKSNFESLCDHMHIVEPETDVGTFEFDEAAEAVLQGYQSTVLELDTITGMIERRETLESKNKRRAAFKSQFEPLVFDEINIEGLDKSQKSYVRKILGKNRDTISIREIESRYFRIFSDDKIKYIYPVAHYKPESGFYSLSLNVKKEKDILVSFGGVFSSRPINTGFVGVRYNLFGRTSATLNANSYFGKFYSSVHASSRFDFSAQIPFSIEPGLTFNRWDYFKSFTTFFEETQPSFIIHTEQFGGAKFKIPVGSKGRLTFEPNYFDISDEYYQTNDFSSADTVDNTSFRGLTAALFYERSTLNRKQFATDGTFLNIRGRFVSGDELTDLGSTASVPGSVPYKNYHEWWSLKGEYTNYFDRWGPITVGFDLEAVASNQPFFANYRATLIEAPAYRPIPESYTFFLDHFRAHNYAAGGVKLIGHINKNIHLRAEGYAFKPFGRIAGNEDKSPYYFYDDTFNYIGSGSLVYQSPIGPLSLSLNYYDQKEDPWSFIFSFGYTLFNRRAFE